MGVFDLFQIPYSALQRDHENVIARASKAGAGILIRGGGRPWRTRLLEFPQLLHGLIGDDAPALGKGGTRRIARRDGSHGVHAALHAHKPRPRFHNRRNSRPVRNLHQNIEAALKGPLPEECDAGGDAASRLRRVHVGAVNGNYPIRSPDADLCRCTGV